MPPSKRPAIAYDLSDDESSVPSSSPQPDSQGSSARKRRRISDDSNTTPEDNDRSRDSVTPASGVDSEDEVETQVATQALRHQRARDRDKGNVARESGVLSKVYVHNFMCHKECDFDLGPLINFICGKNGSGKSAILTAIILCLGGKASTTNRGQNLRRFVKEGEESAYIICDIKNRGEGAFMPDDYGTLIHVERHFTRSGTSGYKLKNDRGRIVSTKKADLEAMMDHFCFQIDNPLNVLSQDMARAFVGATSPAEKYKFFVKGVQLEQLDQDYSLLGEQVESIEAKLRSKEEDVANLEKSMDDAKQKKDEAKKKDGLLDKLREMRRQLIWIQIEQREKDLETFVSNLEDVDRKIAEAEATVNNLSNDCELARERNERNIEAENAIVAELRQQEDEEKERSIAADEAKQEITRWHSEQRKIKDELKTASTNMTAKQVEIAAEEQRLQELNGGGAARRLQELEIAKQAAEEAKQEWDAHKQLKPQILSDIERKREVVTAQEKEKNDKLAKKDERKGQLENAQKSKEQSMRAFRPNTDRLLQEIQKESRFDRKPIGPIGRYVTLKDPAWSSMVEKTFGATLNAFYCFSRHDANIISELKRKVNCDANILTGNNEPLVPKEPDEKYTTVLRILDIDDEAIQKQLIINHNIEQTLLIADVSEATREMYDGPRLRNVKACFSFQPNDKSKGIALSYTSSGEPSQDPVAEYKGLPRLKGNVEHMIEARKQALKDAETQYEVARRSWQAARGEIERANAAVKKHEARERQLRLASQAADDGVGAIEDKIKEDNVESGRLDVLKASLADLEDAKALHDDQYKDAVIQHDAKKDAFAAKEAALAELQPILEQLRSKVATAKRDHEKSDKHKAGKQLELNGATERVKDAQNDRIKLQERRETMTADLVEVTRQAELQSARVAIPEGATEKGLSEKYEKLQAERRRAQSKTGMTHEEATEALKKAVNDFRRASKDFNNLKEVKDMLKSSLHERRMRWEQFRRQITARARIMFVYLLSERGFRGQLLMNHARRLLDLSIEPDITKKSGTGRGTKTLSGGEKSFAQICLLLSMWEAMGSPIRCLDEFDVFMDAVNRNMSVRMIIEAARDSVGKQYILISPGSTKDIPAAPDVKTVPYVQCPPEISFDALTFLQNGGS